MISALMLALAAFASKPQAPRLGLRCRADEHTEMEV
jgi:hypothetical protein